jgi:hypothetical protein
MTKNVTIFKQSAVVSKNVYTVCPMLWSVSPVFQPLGCSDHQGLLGGWFYEYGVLQISSVDCDNNIQIS